MPEIRRFSTALKFLTTHSKALVPYTIHAVWNITRNADAVLDSQQSVLHRPVEGPIHRTVSLDALRLEVQ